LIVAFGVLLLVINIVWSKFKGEPAGADPWDARTLEWSIPSPTPEYNFLETPQVNAVDDFWHKKYTEDEEGRPVLRDGVDLDAQPKRVTTQEAIEKYGVHMPSPSFWPFILALGLPVIGYGLVFHLWGLAAVGIAVTMSGLIGWALEPDTEPAEHGGAH
jgi:cytochrome c oxidase subunit 1